MSADSYGEPFTVQRLRAMVATLPSNIREHSTTEWAADEIDSLRAELAALKARRCDGCVHWTQHHLGRGECGPLGYWFDADHACNAWEPKS